MSGARRVVTGIIVGTGALLDVKTVGFRPTVVEVFNMDSGDSLMWQESMADDTGVKRLAAGTTTVETADCITPLANGFRLGVDADINAADETLHWRATD